MPNATVRYWAGAKAAAGIPEEVVSGATVAELIDQVTATRPAVAAVLTRCSYLLEGTAVHDLQTPISEGMTLEVLPPFAGG